jgi:cell division protein FtsB
VKALTLGTFVIAAIAVSAMLDSDTGLKIWLELRRDLAVSNTRVEQLVRENDALRGEIAILESEPAALDRAIREELDLVLPGEVVVRFEPSSTTLRNHEGPAGGSAADSLDDLEALDDTPLSADSADSADSTDGPTDGPADGPTDGEASP